MPSAYEKLIERLENTTLLSSYHSGKAKCEIGWSWRPQPLLDYDLWYVSAGKGTIKVNEQRFTVSAGSCFLLRPGDIIEADQHIDNRLTVYFIHFKAEQKTVSEHAESSGVSMLQIFPVFFQIDDTVWMETLLNRLLILDDANPSLSNEFEFSSVLRAVFSFLIKSNEEAKQYEHKHHVAIRKIIRFIKENPTTLLTHEELAADVGLSARYLNILFKKHTGSSIKTFLARARIERACHLLAECDMSVSQIAETLGYSDIYFFSKQFKQFVGESPLHYRSRIEANYEHKRK